MANDLKILITGSLNIGKSIGEINTQIKALEKKVNNLKLNISINDNVLSTLKNFSKQMEKIKAEAMGTGKYIEEVMNPDGSKMKRTWTGDMASEFKQTEQAAKPLKETLDKQGKTVEKLTSEYSQLTKEVDRYNKAGEKVSGQKVLSNDSGTKTRTVNTDAKGNTLGYIDTDNIAKANKLNKELTTSVDGLIGKYSKLAESGNLTNKQLEKVSHAISGVKDTKSLEKATSVYDQMAEKAKLAEQMAKGRESAVIKSLSNETAAIQKQAVAQNKANDDVHLKRQTLIQQLNRMSTESKLTESSLNRMNNAVNASKNIDQLNKLEASLSRVEARSQTKFDIGQYQAQAAIKAQNITRTHGTTVDNAGLQSYLASVNALSTRTPNLSNQMQILNTRFNELSGNARASAGALAQSGMSMAEMLGEAAKKFPIWMAASTMFYAPIRAIQDMTSRLIELDTAMVNIKRVMDMPDFKFTDMLTDAVNVSDELSSKLTDVLSIIGDFARMGFSENELIDISKTGQVLQNISDLDATSSVDTLTSAMLNFNIAAKDSIGIADMLNEVDNNYAITTRDLSDSIRKAASTAKTFGVELNQLVGYTAAIGSTTRESGAIIGNGLKTIFSRITTMSSAETALKGVGVAINDLEGNVKPVSGIIDELGEKWHSLSDEQQQNTAVSVAGRYQLSRFLALMNNYKLAQNATETATNSQNSAMEEQAKYADSLEGRINRLDTAWNQFTISVGDAVMTDGLIELVESLGDVTKFAASTVDTFGALPLLLGSIGVTVALLSSKFRLLGSSMGIATWGALRGQITATTTATITQTATTRVQAAALRASTAAAQSQTAAVATLGTAWKGLLISTGIGAAFVVLGVALEKLVRVMGDARREQEEFEASQKTNVEAMTVNKKETESLIASYKRLTKEKQSQKGVTNGTWDTEKDKEYLEVQQKLGTLFPALVDGMTSTGELRLKSASLIDEEIKSTEKLVELKKEELKLNAVDKIKDQQDEINGLFGLEKQVESTQDALESMAKGGASESAINEYSQRLIREQSELATAVAKINDQVLSLSDAYNDFEISPSIVNQVTELVSTLDMSDLNPSQVESYAVSLASYTDEMQRAIEKNNSKSFEVGKQKLIEQAKAAGATKVALSLMNVTFEDVIEKNKQLADASYGSSDGTEILEDSIEGLNGATEETVETMDEYIAKLRELKSAEEQVVGTSQGQVDAVDDLLYVYQSLASQTNLSEAQTLSLADAQAKLSAIYPHLVENGALRIDKIMEENEAQRILLNSVKLSKEGKLSAEDEMTLSSALGTKARIDNIKKEMEAMLSLFTQYMDEANRLANANAGIEADLDAEEAYIKAIKHKNFEMNKTPYKDATAKLNGYIAELNTSTGLLSKSSAYQDAYSKSTDKSAKSTKDATKDSIYFTDKYKNSVESLTLALEKQNAIKSKYPTHSKEHQKAIKSEIALTEQLKKATEDQAKSLDSQIKSGKIAPTGMVTTTSKNSTSNSGGSKASGKGTEANIWNFFKGKGLSDSASAGIMGNLKLESGLSTTAVNKSSGATGIAQWLGGRLSGLKAYAKTLGTSWTDLNTQLEWLWKELNGADSTTKSILNKNGGLDALNNMNASSSALLFEKAFERSGGAALTQRKNNANDYFNKYSGSGGATSSPTIDSSSEESASTRAAQISQAIDQARSELNGLNGDIIGYEEKLTALKGELVNAELDTFNFQRQQYQHTLDFESAKQEAMSTTSKEYRASIDKQITAMNGQQTSNKKELAFLQDLIKNGKLSSIEMTEMKEKVIALKLEMQQLGTAVKNANFDKIQTRSTSFSESQDDLQYLIDLTGEYMGLLQEGSPEYKKEAEDQIATMKKSQRMIRTQITEWEKYLKTTDLLPEDAKKLREDIEDLTLQFWGLEGSIKNSTKALEESMKAMQSEVADKLIQSYKDYQTERKNAHMKTIDAELKAENDKHSQIVKNLKAELDAYKKIIQAKLDMIDKEESERDYNMEIDDLEKERLGILNKINLLSLDNSFESKAERKKLQEDLDNVDKTIAEKRHDRDIELRKENLNDMVKSKEEEISSREELEDQRHENLIKTIDLEKEYWEKHYDDLLNDERKFQKIRQDIIDKNFDAIKSEFGGYLDYLKKSMPDIENTLGGTMKAVGTSIRLNMIDNLNEALKLLGQVQANANSPTTSGNSSQYQLDKGKVTGSPSTGGSSSGGKSDPTKMSGKVTVTKPINLWDRVRGSKDMTSNRVLQKGESFKVYGYEDGSWGRQYDVGANKWITNMPDHIKFVPDAASALSGGMTSDWSGTGVDGKGGRSMIIHPNEIIHNPVDSKRLVESMSIADRIMSNLPQIMLPKINLNNGNPANNGNQPININFNVAKMTGNETDVNKFTKAINDNLKRTKGVRR